MNAYESYLNYPSSEDQGTEVKPPNRLPEVD